MLGLQAVPQGKPMDSRQARAVAVGDVPWEREPISSKTSSFSRPTNHKVSKSPLSQNPFVDPVDVEDESENEKEDREYEDTRLAAFDFEAR